MRDWGWSCGFISVKKIIIILSSATMETKIKKKQKTRQTKTCGTMTTVSLEWDNNGSTAASFKEKGEFCRWNWVKVLLGICTTAAAVGANYKFVQQPAQHDWLIGICTDPEQKLQELWTAHPNEWLNQILTSTAHYYLADQRETSLSKKTEEIRWWYLSI